MTKEEFKKLFNDIVKGTERLDEAMSLLDEVDNLYDNIDKKQSENEEALLKIKDLQDRNQRLYLAVTSTSEANKGNNEVDDDDDLTGVDAMNAFWEGLDNKEE